LFSLLFLLATGGKFIAGVIGTSDKFANSVVDIVGKFAAIFNDACRKVSTSLQGKENSAGILEQSIWGLGT
jgi:hypothetical protein